jgi:hypothetical protein
MSTELAKGYAYSAYAKLLFFDFSNRGELVDLLVSGEERYSLHSHAAQLPRIQLTNECDLELPSFAGTRLSSWQRALPLARPLACRHTKELLLG